MTETVQSAKDKSLTQMYFLDVVKNTLQIVPDFVVSSSKLDKNLSILSSPSLSSATYPKTISINYGTSNYVGNDGFARRGTILITLSGANILKDPFTITFDGFVLNETTLLGTLGVQFNNLSTNYEYKLTLNNDVKCTNANGTMSWNGSALLNRVGGEGTVTFLDDVYEFSEDTKGQDFTGRSFTSKAVSKYTVDFTCKYLVVGGTSDFTPNGMDLQVVDYGSLDCDGKASVTPKGSKPYYFILQ